MNTLHTGTTSYAVSYEQSTGQSIEAVKALVASQADVINKFCVDSGVDVSDLLKNFLTTVYLDMMKTSHIALLVDQDYADNTMRYMMQWHLKFALPIHIAKAL